MRTRASIFERQVPWCGLARRRNEINLPDVNLWEPSRVVPWFTWAWKVAQLRKKVPANGRIRRCTQFAVDYCWVKSLSLCSYLVASTPICVDAKNERASGRFQVVCTEHRHSLMRSANFIIFIWMSSGIQVDLLRKKEKEVGRVSDWWGCRFELSLICLLRLLLVLSK